MIPLLFLTMVAIGVAMCRLCLLVARWSTGIATDERRQIQLDHPATGAGVPDTVPIEWVKAYRAEQDG